MPLNYFLFALLTGLLLAAHLTVFFWWLFPAAILLFFRYFRWGFIVIAAAVWADVVCHTSPITTSVNCQAVAYVDTFPKPRYPFGYQEFIRIIEPKDCPLRRGDRLLGNLFSPTSLSLGTVFQADLKLTPPQDKAYIQREKLRAYATIKNPILVKNTLAPWLVRQRALLAERIKRTFPKHHGWLQALIIGNRSAISSYQREDLKRTGTSHLIAISGLHLGLIALVIFTVLQWLFAFCPPQQFFPRTLALHGSLWLTLIYALLTGGAPPVLRAWFMLLVLVFSWHSTFLRRQTTFLSLAAVLLFLWQPWQFTAASAWLSFAAVALILYSAKYWQGRSILYQLIFLQGLLTLGLLPLSWALYGGFSLVGIVANLLFIPWLAPLLLTVFLALILPPFTPIPQFIAEHYFAALSVLARPNWAYFSPNWQPSLFAALLFTFGGILLLQKYWRLAGVSIFLAGSYSIYLGLTPQQEVIFSNRLPLAIYRDKGEILILNAGGRSSRLGHDDAARWILPELKRHGEKPTAILLTKTGATATTALKTILDQYPSTPIYSLLPAEKIPFPIQYCPDKNESGMIFYQGEQGCVAEFGRWVFQQKK